MKFVGIVGANYDQSYNRKLLEFIRRHFKIKFELEVLEIDEVPMFNQDEKWDESFQLRLINSCLEKPKKPLTLRVTLPMKVLLTSLNNA